MLSRAIRRQSHRPGPLSEQEKTRRLFPQILSNRREKWCSNEPAFSRNTSWGRREYNVLPGACDPINLWLQKPCYLLQDGSLTPSKSSCADTNWDATDRKRQSEVPELHGAQRYEASAVNDTLDRWAASQRRSARPCLTSIPIPMWTTTLQWRRAGSSGPLVQIGAAPDA